MQHINTEAVLIDSNTCTFTTSNSTCTRAKQSIEIHGHSTHSTIKVAYIFPNEVLSKNVGAIKAVAIDSNTCTFTTSKSTCTRAKQSIEIHGHSTHSTINFAYISPNEL